MKTLLLIGALTAGTATFAAPQTAKAGGCYPGGYGGGYYSSGYAPVRSFGYGLYSPRIYGNRGFRSNFGYGGRGYGFRRGYGYGRGYGGFGIGIRSRGFGFGYYR